MPAVCPAFSTPATLKPIGCHGKMQKGQPSVMAAPTMRNTSSRTQANIAHSFAAFFLARPVNARQYRHVSTQPNSQPKHGAHIRFLVPRSPSVAACRNRGGRA